MVYLTSYYQRHRNERLEYQKYYRERLKYDDDAVNLTDMHVVESDQVKKRKKKKIQNMVKTFTKITLTFD